MGFPVERYPKTKHGTSIEGEADHTYQSPADQIKVPGFYYNEPLTQIEHWSNLAPWNQVMADHASNAQGLICDGFQSILPFEDMEHLIDSLKIWKNWIDKQEV